MGIVFSTFDLLHSGHCMMLKEGKEQCDYLIACLQSDPTIDRPDTKNKPVQSMVERYVQLKAVSYVDEIIPYQTEQDVLDILKMFRPNIRIIGEEYRDKDYTGKDYCLGNDIEIYYNFRRHDFSTTNLRERVANVYKK
jgi:glycerol-3-phosphate cytidylyltransferase